MQDIDRLVGQIFWLKPPHRTGHAMAGAIHVEHILDGFVAVCTEMACYADDKWSSGGNWSPGSSTTQISPAVIATHYEQAPAHIDFELRAALEAGPLVLGPSR